MEASGSVRVGARVENATSQPAGGLAMLLTGAPKQSFASLLDGDEPVQPESENRAPSHRKEGDRDGQTSQDRKNEHARNTRSSDDHRDSRGIERPPVNTTGVGFRSGVLPQAPRWDSKLDGQSVGVPADQIKKATELSIESSAMRSRGVSDIGAAPSRGPKGEERSALPPSVISTEGATHGISDANKAKMPELISSPQVLDSGQLDGVPIEFKIDGYANAVPDGHPAIRSDDAGTVVVESRVGSRFTADLVVTDMRQSGGTALPQLMNQLDLSSGGSGHKPDRMPADSQTVDIGEIGAGTVSQLDAHGGQARHDASGQMLRVVQAAGASTRTADGAAVELVNAGQTDAAQRSSVLTENTPGKPMAPERSSREALMQHAADANTTRMVANAMRGELHVGLHTEAFGRVTIQTNTGPGQFSAQVSLEDSKQSAALAAHLPAVEQRILQQHGLDASVRIVSESHTDLAGNSAGNGQRGSGANDGTRGERRGVRAFEQGIPRAIRLAAGDIPRERQVWTPWGGRLDVTV